MNQEYKSTNGLFQGQPHFHDQTFLESFLFGDCHVVCVGGVIHKLRWQSECMYVDACLCVFYSQIAYVCSIFLIDIS